MPLAYGKEGVRMNFVDRIFVGELTNTIMCEECEHVSVCGWTIAKDLSCLWEPIRQSSTWCVQWKTWNNTAGSTSSHFLQPILYFHSSCFWIHEWLLNPVKLCCETYPTFFNISFYFATTVNNCCRKPNRLPDNFQQHWYCHLSMTWSEANQD